MSEEVGVRELLEYTNERITELKQSYLVLNECHHTLEIKFTKLETTLSTLVKLVKFFIAPGTALLVLLELLKAAGIV